MKKIKFLSMMMLAVILMPLMFSCSKDDDGGSGGGGSTNIHSDPTSNPSVADIHVVVSEDGTTSNGSLFSAIDDKNFYVDYVKYTVEEGHLVVSGYDKKCFKDVANIVSSINYKWNSYDVTEIKKNAFKGCTSLTSVTIPSSVTVIQEDAFDNCNNLKFVHINITNLVEWCQRNFEDFKTFVQEYHLYLNGKEIKDLVIPNNLTYINHYAFLDCSSLTSVTIPNSVTFIGVGAFQNCSGLTSIKVESGNTVYDSRDNCNAIIETATNTLIAGIQNTIIPQDVTSISGHAFTGCSGLTSVTIPNSVTSIDGAAFAGCSGLTSLTIPNSVTSIGYFAFTGCSGLTSLTIPNSVTSIGDWAFQDCSGLTSVTIPNSVTSIGSSAFYNCSGLTSVTIPNSVTSIGSGAFYNCSGLTSIHCKRTMPPIVSATFYNSGRATLYVPSGSIDVYKGTSPWGNFNNIVEE